MDNQRHLLSCLLFFALAASAQGFLPAFNKQAAPKVSPLENDAIEIYQKKYQTGKAPIRPFYQTWGIPDRDIDGTVINKVSSGKGIFDVEEKNQRANFKELSRLYGAETALQMTKDLPAVLAFDKNNFAPSLAAYSDIFGEEEAKGMIARNPGLLAVKPADAGGADDTTMKFSYVVAATRPAGPVLLYGLLGLLSLPVIEGVSGVLFRANLINEIMGSV